MRIARLAFVVGGAVLLALTAGCGAKKEKFNVTVGYILEPTQPLPEGLKTVAILDAGTQIDGTEDDDRAKKWATIAADMMESMIHDAATKYGHSLAVAKRRDTAKILAEKDMHAAGLVEPNQAVATGKLLDVQALITSKLNIRVEVKKTKKTTVDAASVAGAAGYYWGGGRAMQPREVEAVTRNMTVQCKFSMLDAASGQSILEYAPKPFRKVDQKKPGPVFGRSEGEADLDPVDEYIGELVEKGVREFVSMFVPCEATYTYTLESSSNRNSAAGIAAMRAEDYAAAMTRFQAAVAEDEKGKDHRTVFAMGVCSELMGDWEGALKYYRQACSMLDVRKEEMDQYLAAKDRVAAHKDRIRRKQSEAAQ